MSKSIVIIFGWCLAERKILMKKYSKFFVITVVSIFTLILSSGCAETGSFVEVEPVDMAHTYYADVEENDHDNTTIAEVDMPTEIPL